jgi:hypothetical protein
MAYPFQALLLSRVMPGWMMQAVLAVIVHTALSLVEVGPVLGPNRLAETVVLG